MNTILGQPLGKEIIAVFVPSTMGNESLTETQHNHYVETTGRLLTTLFGGATAVPSRGFYQAHDGSLITENVAIVWAFTETVGDTDRLQIQAYAQWLCKVLKQESVLVFIDGQPVLVTGW